jgi:hypothetical protein
MSKSGYRPKVRKIINDSKQPLPRERMKGLILPFAALLLSFSTVSNAVSMSYDFAAGGNVHEAGYTLFDMDNHGNDDPGHSAINGLPGGLKITVSDGGNGIEDGQMYLSDMTVSPVPVPTAFWLFGTALIGFVSLSRRTSLS